MVIRIRAAILLASLLATSISRAGTAPIAVVTDPAGSVIVRRAGGAGDRPVTATMFLYAGDRIEAGSDGRATLFPLHAAARALAPGQSVTLQAVPPSARPEALPDDLFLMMRQQFDAAIRAASQPSENVRRGSSRVEVTLLSPRFGVALSARPTFEWQSEPKAPKYTVTLWRGETPLWKTTTSATRVAYPADRPPLPPGEYVWDVMAHAGSDPDLDTAPFRILDPKKAALLRRDLTRTERLSADPNVTPLPYIAVCLQYGLYPEAEAALGKAVKRTPRDRTLHLLRMRVCQRTERWAQREAIRPLTAPATR